ncbi:transmembrane protein 244-like isoform X1 [Perca fluviatilis]|uniref:transmembrane protein 244-like isoform X1 n=1 Tax=Perca fluviatilis TaxID=8168 RepID=UPI00196652B9|nr:transmembrane protein 244-like isoform X1 [Perca fluviatilis]
MPGHILLSFLHDWECVLRCLQVRISHTHAHSHTRKRTSPRKHHYQPLLLDHFDGLIPFDFKTEPAESNSKYLVNLLSLELTYFCSGLLFAAVVRRRVWDYALTITILHVMITSLVMLEFPTVWQWWLALGSGLFLMICNGQLIAYFTCQSDQSYASFSFY